MKWIFLLLYTSFWLPVQKTDRGFDLIADSFYGVDDFEAVYFGKEDVFYKKSGTYILQFYDIQLGDLTEVDLINPLKILLFYKDTQTVVLLDNRLNERQRIRLNDIQPYRFFEHVRLAGERRLWLHDLDNNRLELYDYISDKTLISTAVLKTDVIQFLSDYNFCHVVSNNHVETYNSYGSRTGILEVGENSLMDYDFENLVAVEKDVIKTWRLDKQYRFRESGITTITISEKDIKSLYLKNGKLYIWRGKRVDVYDINPIKK